MRYFITAIGTDSGKTLVSAIICQALQASYWKPVQTGPVSDTDTILSLVSYQIKVFPETYHLKAPLSPHIAAEMEAVKIRLDQFEIPATENPLVIEGAGGILVPLNDNGDTLLDYMIQEMVEVILIINLYLGCINHALLTINELKRRNTLVKGIIFNGTDSFGARDIILSLSGLTEMMHINQEPVIDKDLVKFYAKRLSI